MQHGMPPVSDQVAEQEHHEVHEQQDAIDQLDEQELLKDSVEHGLLLVSD